MKAGLGPLPGTQGKVLPFELPSETMFSVPALASCWGLFLHDGLLLRCSSPRVAHRDFCLACGLVWALRPRVVEVEPSIWRPGQPKWAGSLAFLLEPFWTCFFPTIGGHQSIPVTTPHSHSASRKIFQEDSNFHVQFLLCVSLGISGKFHLP